MYLSRCNGEKASFFTRVFDKIDALFANIIQTPNDLKVIMSMSTNNPALIIDGTVDDLTGVSFRDVWTPSLKRELKLLVTKP